MADFCLIAKRHLSESDYRIFSAFFLSSADWKLCCQRLRLPMDKGNFFHAIYRIEVKMGQAYALTQPFALYPPDSYFGATRDAQISVKPLAVPEKPFKNGLVLRPPMTEPIPDPEPIMPGPVPIVATPHPPFDRTEATARVAWIRKQIRAGYTLRRIANTLNRWRIKPPDLTTSSTLVKPRAPLDQESWTESMVKLEMLSAPGAAKRKLPKAA